MIQQQKQIERGNMLFRNVVIEERERIRQFIGPKPKQVFMEKYEAAQKPGLISKSDFNKVPVKEKAVQKLTELQKKILILMPEHRFSTMHKRTEPKKQVPNSTTPTLGDIPEKRHHK